MSHVATVELEVKDLDALAEAAERCGCELVRGQQTYKWFGEHVGDYPLPAGFTVDELGKCQHAIRVKGNSAAYEVGVVARKDGRQGYTLLWDFWNDGYGLREAIGHESYRLRQFYAVAVASKAARQQGFSVTESLQADGSIKLQCGKF